MDTVTILTIIGAIEASLGIPDGLLKGLCEKESSLRPSAYVHQDGKGKRASRGLCQIQRAAWSEVCSEYSWEKKGFSAKVNAECAGRYLKKQYLRYMDWNAALTAYNQGYYRGVVSGYAKDVQNRAKRFQTVRLVPEAKFCRIN